VGVGGVVVVVVMMAVESDSELLGVGVPSGAESSDGRGVYARMMASRVTGSRRRIIRCWPTGRPRDWVGAGRVKVKILVLGEMSVFWVMRARRQVFGLRKTVEEEVEGSSSCERGVVVGARVPMW
jgi:hypothetical protein